MIDQEDAATAFIAVVCAEILRAGHLQLTCEEFKEFYTEIIRTLGS